MQAAAQTSTNVVTGIPMVDGLIVSTPFAGAFYLWLRSEQKDKAALAEQNRELVAKLSELAEAQVANNVKTRERLTMIERHLGMREAGE